MYLISICKLLNLLFFFKVFLLLGDILMIDSLKNLKLKKIFSKKLIISYIQLIITVIITSFLEVFIILQKGLNIKLIFLAIIIKIIPQIFLLIALLLIAFIFNKAYNFFQKTPLYIEKNLILSLITFFMIILFLIIIIVKIKF